jgi:hypothetical protein
MNYAIDKLLIRNFKEQTLSPTISLWDAAKTDMMTIIRHIKKITKSQDEQKLLIRLVVFVKGIMSIFGAYPIQELLYTQVKLESFYLYGLMGSTGVAYPMVVTLPKKQMVNFLTSRFDEKDVEGIKTQAGVMFSDGWEPVKFSGRSILQCVSLLRKYGTNIWFVDIAAESIGPVAYIDAMAVGEKFSHNDSFEDILIKQEEVKKVIGIMSILKYKDISDIGKKVGAELKRLRQVTHTVPIIPAKDQEKCAKRKKMPYLVPKEEPSGELLKILRKPWV